jgi:hypothetical protein
MDITDFADEVSSKLGKKPKGKPAKKGRSWKGKKVVEKKTAPSLSDDGMHPVKRKGRPPKDAPVVPHERQHGDSHFVKNWRVELHANKYVFFADDKKVGELATKEVA